MFHTGPFMLRPFLLVLVVALCSFVPAFPQSTTARVTGQVHYKTQGAIGDAELVFRHLSTNFSARIFSDANGFYTAALLPPGDYSVTVSKPGFRTLSRPSVILSVDQVAQVNFELELGSVAETVEVRSDPPALEAGNASLGTLIGNEQIKDLPLNSRNPLRFVYLVPGFTPRATFIDQFNRASFFSLNGGRSGMNDLFIDGISNSVPGSNQSLSYAVFPSPDALQEFKVLTNSFSAEFGRAGGGVISMIMRSGTNKFQGTLYEFLRNSALDANDFFANRAGRSLPVFQRSQFGAAIGGPIVRNKLFFFANYEGLRQGQSANFSTTVPTALERGGDFSRSTQMVGSQCLPVQVYDPTTTRAAVSGSGFVRDQFPGNVIPSGRIDAVSRRVLGFMPEANQPGNACTGANNFFSNGSNKFNVNQIDSKVDWFLSEKNRFFGGISQRRSVLTNANFYNNIAYTDFQSAGFEIPSWSARLDFTRAQSATLFFNVRAGFSTVTQDAPTLVPSDFTLASLAFPAGLDSQILGPTGFPAFSINGYAGLGQQYTSPLETFKMFSLGGSLTWVNGRHTVKLGIEGRLQQVGSSLRTYTSGLFNFDRAFTQGPNPNQAAANLGNSIASLLLGTGASGYINNIPSTFTSNFYSALFVQDDIKLNQRLTLNLGIRNDMETGKKDRFGQLAWFDYDAPSPLAGPSGIPNLKGGVRAQGSTADRQYPNSFSNWGPRFGLAWSALPNKLVVRAGYGLLYLPYIGMAAGNLTGTEGFSTQSNWVSSLDGLRPQNYLSDAFPSGLLAPTGANLGLMTNLGQNLTTAIDRSAITSSYVQQWNFTLQYELPGRILIEPAYVGSKGTHLTDLGWEMNQLTPEQLKLGSTLQQLVPNPFQGLIMNGSLAAAQTTRGQLLRPFPQYLSVNNFRPTSASSSYHAFQLRMEKGFAEGSSFLLAYTNGKLINDAEGTSGGAQGLDSFHQDSYYRRAEKSISPQDISQLLTVSGIYQLPLGKGRRFGAHWNPWLNSIAGGWQWNAVLTLATGIPLPITTPNTSGSFSTTLRPNLIGDPSFDGDRSLTSQLQQWFNTTAFAQPTPFTFGNTPRTLSSIRAPGTRRLDFSIAKHFVIHESFRLEFRAESFNLTNTPNFAVPGLSFGTATFGVISAQANTPRQIQLGLKLHF